MPFFLLSFVVQRWYATHRKNPSDSSASSTTVWLRRLEFVFFTYHPSHTPAARIYEASPIKDSSDRDFLRACQDGDKTAVDAALAAKYIDINTLYKGVLVAILRDRVALVKYLVESASTYRRGPAAYTAVAARFYPGVYVALAAMRGNADLVKYLVSFVNQSESSINARLASRSVPALRETASFARDIGLTVSRQDTHRRADGSYPPSSVSADLALYEYKVQHTVYLDVFGLFRAIHVMCAGDRAKEIFALHQMLFHPAFRHVLCASVVDPEYDLFKERQFESRAIGTDMLVAPYLFHHGFLSLLDEYTKPPQDDSFTILSIDACFPLLGGDITASHVAMQFRLSERIQPSEDDPFQWAVDMALFFLDFHPEAGASMSTFIADALNESKDMWRVLLAFATCDALKPYAIDFLNACIDRRDLLANVPSSVLDTTGMTRACCERLVSDARFNMSLLDYDAGAFDTIYEEMEAPFLKSKSFFVAVLKHVPEAFPHYCDNLDKDELVPLLARVPRATRASSLATPPASTSSSTASRLTSTVFWNTSAPQDLLQTILASNLSTPLSDSIDEESKSINVARTRLRLIQAEADQWIVSVAQSIDTAMLVSRRAHNPSADRAPLEIIRLIADYLCGFPFL